MRQLTLLRTLGDNLTERTYRGLIDVVPGVTAIDADAVLESPG